MPDIHISHQAYAKAEMLIRKPVAEVFEAFVNPGITTLVWFTKSTGRLEAGKEITWTWEMYHVSTPVKVISLELNKKIMIEWGNRGEATRVEWTFTEHPGDHTFVSIVNDGFALTGDKLLAAVRDSTEGFTLVLAGMKAWLEHGIRLHLVGDRFPQ